LDWDSSEIIIVVDSSIQPDTKANNKDLVWCNAADNRAMYQQKVALEHISTGSEDRWQNRVADGRWIGLMRSRKHGSEQLSTALEVLGTTENFQQLGLPDLLNYLLASEINVQVMYINGHWLDLNNLTDLERANEFAQGYRT